MRAGGPDIISDSALSRGEPRITEARRHYRGPPFIVLGVCEIRFTTPRLAADDTLSRR